MNNLRDVYPVYVSDAHVAMVMELLDSLDGSIISFGNLDIDVGKKDIDTVDPIDLYKVFGINTRLPYDDFSYDNCISLNILSKVRNPFTMVDEIYRILTDGGIVYAEVPFIQPYSVLEDDLYRFTPQGLRALFYKFNILKIGMVNGPGSALHWIKTTYDSLQFDIDGDINTISSRVGSDDYMNANKLLGMHNEYIKFTDELYNNKEHACTIASSLYIIGEKYIGISGGDAE